MNKLLVSDYDGTYKIKSYDENDINLNNIAIENFIYYGNKFIISTGRTYADILPEIENFNIFANYLSCANGNVIFDIFSNLIFYNVISYKDIEDFKNFFKFFEYIKSFNCYGEEDDKNIVEFKIKYKNYEVKENFKKYLLENNIHNFYHSPSDPLIIHFFNNNGSKVQSIDIISRLHNINSSDIYCIGDRDNDLDMIKKYNGYAIQGAKEHIKKDSLSIYNSVADLANDIIEGRAKIRCRKHI